MAKVAASLLAAPPLSMITGLREMEKAGVDMFHLDIMDGMFVPNISFGMDTVRAVREVTKTTLDVHLMIEKPERYLEAFFKAGADRLTVHVEACEDPAAVLQEIAKLGMKPGLSLRPATPVKAVEPFLPLLQNILVMTVNPGFGGQKLIWEAAEKIRFFRDRLDAENHSATISVDGGINAANAPDIVRLGADVLIMGTALLGAEHPDQMVSAVQQMGIQ